MWLIHGTARALEAIASAVFLLGAGAVGLVVLAIQLFNHVQQPEDGE
ncbi:MAG TPA: hypothetical protein VFZ93_09075 [Albitalea sp.]